MYVVDGAYNFTPQEYIDLMNRTTKNQVDGEYLTLPNWDEATAGSIWIALSFRIAFETNNDGKITRISYHWKSATEAANTAAFLVGVTITILTTSEGQGDNIIEQLDMFNFSKKSYENNCDVDGNHFYYMSANYGEHNWFSVDISDSKGFTFTQPQPEKIFEAPYEPAEIPSSGPAIDERGIDGMDPFAFQMAATDTFGIPYAKKESNNPDYSAYTCVSSGEVDGISYDYSISLDSDEEIIGASFGVTALSASSTDLFYAADLYFYSVSLIAYDTGDKEALLSWFTESLPNASSEAISITLGDAKFDLYGMNGGTYWVDISKAP